MKKPRGSPVRAECDPAHCGPGAVRFQPSYYGSVRNEIYARGAVLAARPDAMSDDRALKSWVSDQLHGLLGFAEGNLASYVVGLGTSRRERPFPVAEESTFTRSPPRVSRERQPLTSVRSHPGPVSSPRPLAPQARRRRTPRRSPRSSCRRGLPDTPATRAFAASLIDRVPGAGGGGGRAPSAYKRDEREAAALAAKNRSYAMLEDDDEDARAGPSEARGAAARRRRGGVGSRRSTANAYVRREDDDDASDSEDQPSGSGRADVLREKKGDRNSPSEEPETRLAREKEEARAADLAERDVSPTGFGAATNSTRSDSRRVRTRRRTRMP